MVSVKLFIKWDNTLIDKTIGNKYHTNHIKGRYLGYEVNRFKKRVYILQVTSKQRIGINETEYLNSILPKVELDSTVEISFDGKYLDIKFVNDNSKLNTQLNYDLIKPLLIVKQNNGNYTIILHKRECGFGTFKKEANAYKYALYLQKRIDIFDKEDSTVKYYQITKNKGFRKAGETIERYICKYKDEELETALDNYFKQLNSKTENIDKKSSKFNTIGKLLKNANNSDSQKLEEFINLYLYLINNNIIVKEDLLNFDKNIYKKYFMLKRGF